MSDDLSPMGSAAGARSTDAWARGEHGACQAVAYRSSHPDIRFCASIAALDRTAACVRRDEPLIIRAGRAARMIRGSSRRTQAAVRSNAAIEAQKRISGWLERYATAWHAPCSPRAHASVERAPAAEPIGDKSSDIASLAACVEPAAGARSQRG